MTDDKLSVAIETSCRAGGAALGRGDELIAAVDFDASARHAAQLIMRLDALLTGVALARAIWAACTSRPGREALRAYESA